MYRTGSRFKQLNKDNKGTTLIELVIYISISAIVLVELAGILSQVVYDQTKVEAIAREDENARTVMHVMSQSIEEAQVINSPYGANSTSGTLNITDRSNNTLTYYDQSGIIYKTINGGSPIQISSSDVYVENLTFTVESEAGVSPSMNIKLDMQQSQTNSKTLTHYETTDAQRIE